MTARVAVVGGGLAGIAAALGCVDAGLEVILCESRPWLGGLTHSFRRGDLWVDNGQHVFLRCCDRYRALLARLGVDRQVYLQQRLDIPVRGPDATGRLRRLPLPAPLHLSWALLRYPWLTTTARARFVRAALALRAVDAGDPRSDARSFGDWLREYRQDRAAIDSLWDLVGIATLNARADDVSLALAATVFQIGLLTMPDAADIGWSRVPLRQLHGDAARAALAAAGATVATHAKVGAVHRTSTGWTVSLAGTGTAGTGIGADAVVLAVPPVAAAALLPPDSVDLPPNWAAALGSSPIVNVHVVYDRQVTTEPFLAGTGTVAQWVFDRTQAAGLTSGQYLAVSVSAADEFIDRPLADLREHFLPALRQLLPAARAARVRDFFVTRERHATFRPAPGTARLRPAARTALPGLYLAGAWTDTGWPATMEGAVRSGESAVAQLISDIAGIPATEVVSR
jgi:squalene-associated FAD-dependent desaturase